METATLIGAVLRAGLQVAAGSALTSGMITDSDITMASGAVAALISLAWSIWQKRKAH